MIQRERGLEWETFGQIGNVFKRFTLLCFGGFVFGKSFDADRLGAHGAGMLANPAPNAESRVHMRQKQFGTIRTIGDPGYRHGWAVFDAGPAFIPFGMDDTMPLEEVGQSNSRGFFSGEIQRGKGSGWANLGAAVALVFAVGPGKVEYRLLEARDAQLEKTRNQGMGRAFAHTELAGRALGLEIIQRPCSRWQGRMQRFPVVDAGVVIGDAIAMPALAVPPFALSASLTISGSARDQAGGDHSGPQEQAAVLGRRRGLVFSGLRPGCLFRRRRCIVFA